MGAELFRRVFPRPFVAVDVASDGARAVAARPGGAWLVDLATGARVTALPDGQAAARFSPDGALLALDGGPGEVALRRARDGALVAVLAGAPDDVRALAFDAEAARLAAFSDAAEVVVWDVATGAARRYDAPLAYAPRAGRSRRRGRARPHDGGRGSPGAWRSGTARRGRRDASRTAARAGGGGAGDRRR
ncbi:MAG: hypothetical protein H6745_08890 [Deltaproteobacteria bacterium]|nr:hypothetical protein [Deltaproteobacteria bacterium]